MNEPRHEYTEILLRRGEVHCHGFGHLETTYKVVGGHAFFYELCSALIRMDLAEPDCTPPLLSVSSSICIRCALLVGYLPAY